MENVKNMRRGFTMIELIFVIVIIGILAAIALPKLMATRDDARISNIIANTRTGLGDMTAFYTAQGSSNWDGSSNPVKYASDVTNIVFMTTACVELTMPTQAITETSFNLCDERGTGGINCIEFGTIDEGNVTITSTGGSVICDAVAADPVIVGMAGAVGVGKEHQLGGQGVVR